jgi:7-keto-8-aminopelargonate synthetase-like enzyme
MYVALETRIARITPHACLRRLFAHNDMRVRRLSSTQVKFVVLRKGKNNVFVVVKSVYGMYGTVAPFYAIIDVMGKVFPACNAHLDVEKAYTTGI